MPTSKMQTTLTCHGICLFEMSLIKTSKKIKKLKQFMEVTLYHLGAGVELGLGGIK